jgi:hypothetical protein
MACAVSSDPLSMRTNAGDRPVRATISSSTATVLSAVMERSTLIASASRVNSSVTDKTFKVLMSVVWSKQKSRVQTWSGYVARSRAAGRLETPTRERFLARRITCRPSSRHSRWMRSWLTENPSMRSSAVSRR